MSFSYSCCFIPPLFRLSETLPFRNKRDQSSKNAFLTVYTFVHELIFTVTTVLKVWKHLQKSSVVVEIKETQICNFHAYINFYTTAKNLIIMICLYSHQSEWGQVVSAWSLLILSDSNMVLFWIIYFWHEKQTKPISKPYFFYYSFDFDGYMCICIKNKVVG